MNTAAESPVAVDAIVVTNYDTGPFRVLGVSGPCDCPRYIDEINLGMAKAPRSEAHYHLTCECVESGREAWLNGYRLDGTPVWGNDRLTRTGTGKGQGSLF